MAKLQTQWAQRSYPAARGVHLKWPGCACVISAFVGPLAHVPSLPAMFAFFIVTEQEQKRVPIEWCRGHILKSNFTEVRKIY